MRPSSMRFTIRCLLAPILFGCGCLVIFFSRSINDIFFVPLRYPDIKLPITAVANSWTFTRLNPGDYDAWVEYPRSGPVFSALPVEDFDLATGKTVPFTETDLMVFSSSDGWGGYRVGRFRAEIGRRYVVRLDLKKGGKQVIASRTIVVIQAPIAVRKNDDMHVLIAQAGIAARQAPTHAFGDSDRLGLALRIIAQKGLNIGNMIQFL